MKKAPSWTVITVVLAFLFSIPARPAIAAGFDDALKQYWEGRTSEALDTIKAYQKTHPDDSDARLWKTIIRMERAIELESSDKDASGRIALSEWGTFWDVNKFEEDTGAVSGSPWLYKIAEAKVYWLNNRRYRSYKAMKEVAESTAPIPEALHFKGFMEYEGYLVPTFSTDPSDKVASAEAAVKSFAVELALVGKTSPGESLRSAYWLAKGTCRVDPMTSREKLSKIFAGIDIGLPGSVYSPLVKDMIEKGCPKK